MRWPAPENQKPPEGHYQFRLNREPELKQIKGTKLDGTPYESRKVVIYARALGEHGEFSVVDSFVPWDDRYAALLSALGVEHSKDIEVSGSIFEGDIVHEADKKDPTKSWARIANIKIREDVLAGPDPEDDDIPF